MDEQITKNHNFTRDPITGQNRIAKGNTIGRMKKKGFTLNDLNKIVVEYEKTHDQTLLKHYIEQLFKDNTLLGKYMDKNIPTINRDEVTGAGGTPLNLIIKLDHPETTKENG